MLRWGSLAHSAGVEAGQALLLRRAECGAQKTGPTRGLGEAVRTPSSRLCVGLPLGGVGVVEGAAELLGQVPGDGDLPVGVA